MSRDANAERDRRTCRSRSCPGVTRSKPRLLFRSAFRSLPFPSMLSSVQMLSPFDPCLVPGSCFLFSLSPFDPYLVPACCFHSHHFIRTWFLVPASLSLSSCRFLAWFSLSRALKAALTAISPKRGVLAPQCIVLLLCFSSESSPELTSIYIAVFPTCLASSSVCYLSISLLIYLSILLDSPSSPRSVEICFISPSLSTATPPPGTFY